MKRGVFENPKGPLRHFMPNGSVFLSQMQSPPITSMYVAAITGRLFGAGSELGPQNRQGKAKYPEGRVNIYSFVQ